MVDKKEVSNVEAVVKPVRDELYRGNTVSAVAWRLDGSVKNYSLTRFDRFSKRYEDIRIYTKEQADDLLSAMTIISESFGD